MVGNKIDWVQNVFGEDYMAVRCRRGVSGVLLTQVSALVLGAMIAIPNPAFAQAADAGSEAQPAAQAAQDGQPAADPQVTAAPVEAAAEPGTPPTSDTDVVVTGSRIARAGFSAPTPLTVVGAERLNNLAQTNVGEALATLPSIQTFQSPTNSFLGFSGNLGSRTIDLRGLGPQRTLVLLNGRRFVPSSSQGTVDVNLIPTLLVDRIEIVTGGASAAYGSDAVAGVVNIILADHMTGLRGQVLYGESDSGDDQTFQAGLAGGFSLFDGAVQVVAGGEYSDNDGVGNCYTRDWCAIERSNFNNADFRTNGLPAAFEITHNHWAAGSPGGLINAGPLKGIQFDPSGNPVPFHYGTYVGSVFMAGGDGHGTNPFTNAALLKAPVERYALYSRITADLGSVQASLDLSYGRVRAQSNNQALRESAMTIRRDNPFLPDAIVTAMTNANITSFTMGRQGDDIGFGLNRGDNRTFRAVAALSGPIGGTWAWDAYYQYGDNRYEQSTSNNKNIDNFNRAIDAVRGPNNTIVCRSTLTDPTNGCSPLNLIGENNFSQAAIDYVFGTSWQTTEFRQHVAAANLHGQLFPSWRNPISLAGGVEYRRDSITGDADPVSRVNGWNVGNGQAINGAIDVVEGYLEALVPLGRGDGLLRVLDLNGAVRMTDYSTSGTVTTWKVGLVWEPIEAVRFRATRSRDIRAPNILELNGGTSSALSRVIDPLTATNFLPRVFTGSNPDLDPEIADTWTVGVVLRPSFIPRFRLAVDYFDIKLDGAITSSGGQTIVDRCAAGVQLFCDLITFGPGPARTILEIRNPLLNLARLATSGIDFEADYSLNLEKVGNFNLRVLATYVAHLVTTDAVGSIDRAGQTGFQTGAIPGVPRWTVNSTLTYSSGPLTLTTEGRYIPRGIYDVTRIGPQDEGYATTLPASISNNRVTGRVYVNLGVRYNLLRAGDLQLELFGGINNLFDKDPPVSVGNGIATNAALFDTIGRTYRGGLRFRY
jgi:iron complex outermembrane recepter protein